MFKVNIEKWIKREIASTELALLRAEDELNEAQYRVKTIRSRLARLKGRQAKAAQAAQTVAIQQPFTKGPLDLGEESSPATFIGRSRWMGK